jgi:hypothetical protein
MPEPVEAYDMLPIAPNPAAEDVKQEVVQKVKEGVAAGGAHIGDALDGIGDLVEAGVDVIGSDVAAEAASAALEVGGEVVGGALEALGSGFEVVGGCAEGCSLVVAVVVLLAAAGSALALGLF